VNQMLTIVMAGAVTLVLAGCSGSQSTWYDQAAQEDAQKQGYVQDQQQFGKDEAQAKRDWLLQKAIEQTEGRQAVEVSGAELQDKIAP
jgi:hypothetical protein